MQIQITTIETVMMLCEVQISPPLLGIWPGQEWSWDYHRVASALH
jgi:hypothetical protein